jgi:TonB family protein
VRHSAGAPQPGQRVADCSRALQFDPAQPDLHLLLGEIRSAQKDHAGAVHDYTAAIAEHPEDGYLRYKRGCEKAEVGDRAGALDDFRKALTLNPSDSFLKTQIDEKTLALGPSAAPAPGQVPSASGTAPLSGPPPVPGATTPPAPVAPPPPPAAEPIRLPSGMKEPRILKHVDPTYPKVAVTAREQGVVILDATIMPDGTVTNVTVLQGRPLLDQAAIDAVRQWVYEPTTLKVPVIMTVTVTFSLK